MFLLPCGNQEGYIGTPYDVVRGTLSSFTDLRRASEPGPKNLG